MTFHSFPSPEALAAQLAADVAQSLASAVEKRERAELVVSGGGTPKLFFAQMKKQNLPWEKIWVTLTDERWVDTDSPDSNEHMIREQLLTHGVNFIGLKSNAPTPAEAVPEVEKKLDEMPRPYDVVII